MNEREFLYHQPRFRQYRRDFDHIIDNSDRAEHSNNESDLLWDDASDEIPVSRFHPEKVHTLSSSSSLSTSDDDEEACQDDEEHDQDGYSITSSTSSSCSDSKGSSNDSDEPLSVLEKIEEFIAETCVDLLMEDPDPSVPEIDVEVDSIGFKRKLSLHNRIQSRALTSIYLVAAFCYDLLAPPAMEEDENESEALRRCVPARKTTTTREVYYFYVTHFRDQRECEKAIWDLIRILNLPSRRCLGLVASPKGWFCGSIDVYNGQTNELKFNGRDLDMHGMAITPSTYDNSNNIFGSVDSIGGIRNDSDSIRIESDAQCILVIEKEGVYTRLSEDKFFLKYFPCILVTGKGFPDLATRQWVWRMQRILKIPAYGLCDCNPYGVSVLDTYRYHQGVKLSTNKDNRSRKSKGRNRTVDAGEDDDFFEINWIGLRPSQVEALSLPIEAFQQLTTNDTKRLDSLLAPKPSGHKPFAERGRNRAERARELRALRKYKVELEALHWKGADYLSKFVYEMVMAHQSNQGPKRQEAMSDSSDDSDDDTF